MINQYTTPSSLLAYCCIKSDPTAVNLSLQDFTNLAGQQPNLLLETPSQILYLLLSASTQTGKDSTGNIQVILHGEIYEAVENQAAYLAEQFARYGDTFVKDIHGSFAILLVDQQKDRVALITDRINSRRIFWSQYAEGFCLSSKFSDQPWDKFKLDPIGIAWYISNVKIRNCRTLLDGVLTFERASIHNLTKEGIKSTKYWIFQINSSMLNPNRKELVAQLSDLLIQSVQRRLYDKPDLFLSLSGGYDATGILGILAGDLQVPGVHCFSYEHGIPQPNSDAHVSHLMAESVGYTHETVESYTGNFINHILDNAQMGLARGLSWNCAELEAWKTLAQRFSSVESPVMLAGDECLGWKNYSLQSWSDVLTSLQIYGFEVLFLLAPLLPDETYEHFKNGLAEDMDEIVRSCPLTTNLRDSEYLLKLDEVIANWIMPWRENFAGQFVTIRNPLLDNDILDFMTTVPSSLRRNKQLYRQTIVKKYPQLFQFPRASSGNYYFNLTNEFKQHAAPIKKLIETQESRLDEIIPPDVLLKILETVLNTQKNPASPATSDNLPIFGQMLSKLSGKFSRFFPPQPKSKIVNPENLLLRLMILRTTLTRNH